MEDFKKVQRDIDPARLVSRQHAIPFDVRKYAGEQQLAFNGQRGRGRSNVPSLADIYHQLTVEGLDLVLNNTWPAAPVFTEIGQPDNCAMARIRFDIGFDQQLRALKSRADAGEFNVVPADTDARQVTKISLISLAVNLIRLAIAERGQPAVMPEPQINLKKPFVSREDGGKARRERKTKHSFTGDTPERYH